MVGDAEIREGREEQKSPKSVGIHKPREHLVTTQDGAPSPLLNTFCSLRKTNAWSQSLILRASPALCWEWAAGLTVSLTYSLPKDHSNDRGSVAGQVCANFRC